MLEMFIRKERKGKWRKNSVTGTLSIRERSYVISVLEVKKMVIVNPENSHKSYETVELSRGG